MNRVRNQHIARLIPVAIARIIDRLTISQSLVHLRGKFRRFYLVTFRKAYVKKQLSRRVGQCSQCGRCCALCFTCLMLSVDGACLIYGLWRHSTCTTFPIDDRDLADVQLTGGKCGFHFEPSTKRDSCGCQDTKELH